MDGLAFHKTWVMQQHSLIHPHLARFRAKLNMLAVLDKCIAGFHISLRLIFIEVYFANKLIKCRFVFEAV